MSMVPGCPVYRSGSQPAPSQHIFNTTPFGNPRYFHLQYVHHLQNDCHCKETISPSYVDWILSSNKTTIKVPCSAPETRLNKKAAPNVPSLEITTDKTPTIHQASHPNFLHKHPYAKPIDPTHQKHNLAQDKWTWDHESFFFGTLLLTFWPGGFLRLR